MIVGNPRVENPLLTTKPAEANELRFGKSFPFSAPETHTNGSSLLLQKHVHNLYYTYYKKELHPLETGVVQGGNAQDLPRWRRQ
jgi:hypothetical protein